MNKKWLLSLYGLLFLFIAVSLTVLVVMQRHEVRKKAQVIPEINGTISLVSPKNSACYNEIFTINIMINSHGQPLASVQMAMNYSSNLEFQGTQINGVIPELNYKPNQVIAAQRLIQVAAYLKDPTATPVIADGDTLFGTMQFKLIGAGPAVIKFVPEYTGMFIVGNNTNILASTTELNLLQKTVTLRLTADKTTFSLNEIFTVNIMINPKGLPIASTQLSMVYSPNLEFQGTQVSGAISSFSYSPNQVNSSQRLIQVATSLKDTSQPFIASDETLYGTMKFKPLNSGTASIVFQPDNTAVFGVDSNSSVLDTALDFSTEITSATPTPTPSNTPTPTPTRTPTPTPTNTPTPTPTRTPTPTPTKTPTPTPTLTPTPKPTYTPTPSPTTAPSALSFKIKFQGINTERTGPTLRIIFRQNGEEVYRFDQIVPNPVSGNNGVYSAYVPVNQPGTYDVFIKGWVHLQKMFGPVSFAPDQTTETDWTATPLPAGDITGPNGSPPDNIVDGYDFAVFVGAFDPFDAAPQGTLSDLDLNGLVNGGDFAMLVGNFNPFEGGD